MVVTTNYGLHRPEENDTVKSAFDNIGTDMQKIDKTMKEISDSIPTELPADGGDSATVNGHTVNSDVPANAKFTDTVYKHPDTHPYSMISGAPTELPANGGNADTVDGLHLVVSSSVPTNDDSNIITFVV